MDFDISKINVETIKRYLNQRAIGDFDRFLDDLPMNVGYNALVIVGIMWAVAAGMLYFASNQADKAAEMRSNLIAVKSIKPPVPKIEYLPVDKKKLDEFSEVVKKLYQGLTISPRAGGQIMITAADTDFFPQFLAAVSYIQRGARNWKVDIKEMCVGRDCKSNKLMVVLVVQTVKIAEPEK